MVNMEFNLVKRALSGDNNAFRQIVETYKKKIFHLGYDLTGSCQDAEDLSQEVFMKAFRSLENYRGEASLGSWLYRITVNTFIDQRRKVSYQAERNRNEWDDRVISKDFLGNNIPYESPEVHAESMQIQAHIEQALQKLSSKERLIFVLRHYEGMSGKSVAELLNISDGTVKSYLFRAIKKLQKALAFYRDSRIQEVVQ